MKQRSSCTEKQCCPFNKHLLALQRIVLGETNVSCYCDFNEKKLPCKVKIPKWADARVHHQRQSWSAIQFMPSAVPQLSLTAITVLQPTVSPITCSTAPTLVERTYVHVTLD